MVRRFEVEGFDDPTEHRELVDNTVREHARWVVAKQEEMLRALPVGWRLCLHGGLMVRTEPDDDIMSDRIKFKMSQKYHTLKPGEVCNHPDRTEYGPKPAVMPPTLTVNRLTASLSTDEGDCPECGKPGARWVATPALTVLSHATDADHDACPDVQRQRAVDKLLDPAVWESMYADAFDDIAWRGTDRTSMGLLPPLDAPALGIITTPPAATEPEDATSLYDKLHEMFKRFNESGQYRPDPPPVVSPETIARHQAAAELPRAPWIAVRNPFQADPIGPSGEMIWMNWEADRAIPSPFNIDPWGSLMGRRLFRTGQFIARPDGRGGWDVAEIMVSS
jgi:hypothetical protein